jgi:hypothetical protein
LGQRNAVDGQRRGQASDRLKNGGEKRSPLTPDP